MKDLARLQNRLLHSSNGYSSGYEMFSEECCPHSSRMMENFYTEQNGRHSRTKTKNFGQKSFNFQLKLVSGALKAFHLDQQNIFENFFSSKTCSPKSHIHFLGCN